jgi:hypothetical protein
VNEFGAAGYVRTLALVNKQNSLLAGELQHIAGFFKLLAQFL